MLLCCRAAVYMRITCLLPCCSWLPGGCRWRSFTADRQKCFWTSKAGGAPPQVRHRCFCFSCCSGGVKAVARCRCCRLVPTGAQRPPNLLPLLLLQEHLENEALGLWSRRFSPLSGARGAPA